MLVREVMNRNVIVAKKDITTKEASQLMSQLHISSLVIVDNKNSIVGILTKGDILKAIASEKKPDITLAEELMSKKVVTIEPNKSIEETVEIMAKNKVRELPVIDGKKIVGIVSASDIVLIEPKLISSLASMLSIQPGTYAGG